MTKETPWGWWYLVDCDHIDDNWLIKKIYVEPHEELSLQYHNNRSEFWLVIEGTATVLVGVGDKKSFKVADINMHSQAYQTKILKTGENIIIEKRQHHQLINNSDEILVVLEVQMGQCSESDIVRLKDKYNR